MSVITESLLKKFSLCFCHPSEELTASQQKDQQRVFAIGQKVLKGLKKIELTNPEQRKKLNLLIYTTELFLKQNVEDTSKEPYQPGLASQGMIKIASSLLISGSKKFYAECLENKDDEITEICTTVAESTLYVQNSLSLLNIRDDSQLHEFKGKILTYIGQHMLPRLE